MHYLQTILDWHLLIARLDLFTKKTGDYSKALSFHENAVAIRRQIFLLDNAALTISHNNMGSVREKMGEYSKAFSFHGKALQIQQKTLSPNHPDVAQSYSHTGSVYSKMCQYPMARQFHQQAVDNGQQSLPINHPRLQQWRKNLEYVKRKCTNLFIQNRKSGGKYNIACSEKQIH
jgi:tetratricopeptide (TPR) repeat protein